jgi:hypothetical protein
MLEIFHSKTAQSFGTWIGILTAVFTGIAKLIPEWFGQFTLAQLVLLAFCAALATLLLLAVAVFLLGSGGALYRRFRPLTDASAAERPAHDPDLERRLARLEHNHGNLRDKVTASEVWQRNFGRKLNKKPCFHFFRRRRLSPNGISNRPNDGHHWRVMVASSSRT